MFSFTFTKGLVLLASALLLSSCASVKIDQERASKVKTVAILALEVQQEYPTDNLGIGRMKELNSGRPGDSIELQAMMRSVHADLSTQLAKSMGWKTVPLDAMKAKPGYKAKVASMMTNFRTVSLASRSSELTFLQGTLDSHAFHKLSHEERVALARELGADAVAVVLVLNEIEQSAFSFGHLSGDASFQYTAQANLEVYDTRSDDVLVRINGVKGDQTEESTSLPKEQPKNLKIALLSRKAANSAFEKLVAKVSNR